MLKYILSIVLFTFLSTDIFSQARVGEVAPVLSVDEWLKGNSVTSFEKGTVYLLEFWGTWCGPCIKNIPHLSEIQKKYSDKDLIVVGVATHEWDGKEKLTEFMNNRGGEMEYTVAYDSDLSMQRDWDTGKGSDDEFRLPVCFLIDRNGKVVFIGHPASKELNSIIETTVKK